MHTGFIIGIIFSVINEEKDTILLSHTYIHTYIHTYMDTHVPTKLQNYFFLFFYFILLLLLLFLLPTMLSQGFFLIFYFTLNEMGYYCLLNFGLEVLKN
jgi:hypothetical protein